MLQSFWDLPDSPGEETVLLLKLSSTQKWHTSFSAPGRFPLFARLTASSKLFNCNSNQHGMC